MRLFRSAPKPSWSCLWLSSTVLSVQSFSAGKNSVPVRWASTRNYLRSMRRISTSKNAQQTGNEEIEPSSACNSKIVKVALCQFKVAGDKSVNLETCATFLDQAAARGAELVVLPEIWNSPYAVTAFETYAEELPDLPCTFYSASPSAELVRKKAAQHKLWIVAGSIPEIAWDQENGSTDKLYNTCLVFDPHGNTVAKHRKVHLFDIDIPGGITFKESETLSPGNEVTSFETPWGRIGLGICYDMRFAEYAMLLSQQHGCKILIYPGAFNLTTGPAHWELLQRGRAVDNQCYVLTASPARTEDPGNNDLTYPHYTAWGHSTAVAPWGDVVATTDEREGIIVCDLNIERVDELRKSIPIAEQKRHDLYNLSKATY